MSSTTPAPPTGYICRYCRLPSDAGGTSCPNCGAPVDVRSAVSDSGWLEQPAIKDMARLLGHSRYVPERQPRTNGLEDRRTLLRAAARQQCQGGTHNSRYRAQYHPRLVGGEWKPRRRPGRLQEHGEACRNKERRDPFGGHDPPPIEPRSDREREDEHQDEEWFH